MKDKGKVIILLALVVLIAVFPLFLIEDSEFGGADDAAEDLIGEINPSYEAWAEPLYEPPGAETESLLFALQAALGAAILGGGFGYYKGRSDRDKKAKN